MAAASDFIGRSKKGAQDLAEARNLVFRLVSVDGENMLGWPEDKFEQRVCCVLAGGKVTQAELR